jgi:hypothetical protein
MTPNLLNSDERNGLTDDAGFDRITVANGTVLPQIIYDLKAISEPL